MKIRIPGQNVPIEMGGAPVSPVWYEALQYLEKLQPLSDIDNSTINAAIATKIGKVVVQTFSVSGTYTPTANMVFAIIECVGAGGGGGGAASSAANQWFGAGGGASGEYARKRVTAADVGASKAVTIGTHGNGATAGANTGGTGTATSVGTLCIANGGTGGTGASAGSGSTSGAGGSGGTGDLTVPGRNGEHGQFMSGGFVGSIIAAYGGAGGSAVYGSGGRGATAAAGSANGSGAANYGSGGGGGACGGVASSNGAGGDGSNGFVFITEFCTS